MGESAEEKRAMCERAYYGELVRVIDSGIVTLGRLSIRITGRPIKE